MDVRIDAEKLTPEEEKAQKWALAITSLKDSPELRALGHQASRRGKQRAVALLLGAANPDGEIQVYRLRWLLQDLGIFDKANFAQDMTKDSTDGRGNDDGLWTVHTYRSGRKLAGSYNLTASGKKIAQKYADFIEKTLQEKNEHLFATARKAQHYIKTLTFTIKPKTPRCPLCREDVSSDEDKAVCKCGSTAHATCLAEFHGEPCYSCRGHNAANCDHCEGRGIILSKTCVLRNTTAQCHGEYVIVVGQPALTPPAEEGE